MDLLLRRSVTGDGKETVDHVLSGSSLVLGSDEGSDFLVSGLPGRITVRGASGGRVRLKSKGLALQQGEKTTRKTTLSPGDEVEVLGLTLRVFAAPDAFDAGLEILGELAESGLSTSQLVGNISPWPIRTVSWVLAASVLLLLIIPLLTQYEALGPLGDIPGMPSDTLWSSGPLAAVHRAAGLSEQCSSCHEKPFRMVADQTCVTCHNETREHIDPTEFTQLAMHETRCASCHREHNEPEWLVQNNDQLCTDCHAAPELWRESQMENPHAVESFSAQGHPEFRLSVWQPLERNAALGWALQRTRTAAGDLADPSALKFNHEVHLNPEKVLEPDGDAPLVCASCHGLKDDGEHFEAISMDGQCRSCHQLNFDPFDPDIELPHGNTRAAFETMEAHFIREFTDPVLRAERVQQKPRRLPGKRMAAASCVGDGLSCGRQEAEREASYQFADTGCVTCHQVTDTGAAAAIDRWSIHPVKLTSDWYTQSRFDHRSHLSLDGSSGDDVCLSCHNASESRDATDVLIPGQSNCLQCHAADTERAPSDCTACHQMHRTSSPAVSITRRGHLP